MSPTPCQTENGSIIITIVVMLVLISLGAGVVLMFSSATVQRAEHANRLRAAQLAEAGFRYAAGEYRSAGSISDKFDRLAALHGEEVTLQSGNGSFSLDIRPYWFVLETAVSNSAGLTLKVPGKFPDGYADTLPSSGTVRINDNFYDYIGGTISLGTGLAPDRFLITLESAVTLPKNTSVQMAFFSPMSQNITAGGDFVLSADNTLLDLLPERNGLIELFKDATHSLGTYRYRERKTGSIILSDISPVSDDELPFSLSSDSLIVLKKQAKVLSHSKLGSGYLTSDLGLALNVYLTDQLQIPEDNSEPLNLGGAGAARHDPFEDEIDGHTQLENWEFDADNSVPESDKKTITTQTVRTEFGGDWDSARYVTFQNFTETNQDHGYTADVVDKERLPEAVRSRNLNGVWGNASNNIYFVGDHGTIMHWDGTHYSLMDSTTTENLNAIWGVPDIKTDPDELDNIFVVGDNGMTLITQNGSWIRAHHNETYDIHAAWGTSWGHFDGYGEAGTNPYNWDSPQTADQLANYNWYINEFGGHVNFRCLWATEHTYRYAPDYGSTGYRPHQNIIVGEFSGGANDGDGIIMHEFYEPAVVISSTPLRGVWGSSFSNIYAVGENGSIYHNTAGDAPDYEGPPSWLFWRRPSWKESWQGGWYKIPSADIPTSANLNGVYGNSEDDFYVIGDNGTILYNKGSGFQLVPTQGVTSETLNSIWGSDRTGIYAVGNNGTIVFLGYPSNKIGGHILPLDKNSDIAAHWSSSGKYLSYTIQTKTVWGDALNYAASGIVFRWHQPISGKYAGYGISFLRYDSSLNDINDMIPNDIKPGFYATDEKNDKLLIVLWEQYIRDGAEQRRWLAYKDVSQDSKAVKTSNGTPRDLSSLIIRVREKRVEDLKLNDIEVYYANSADAAQASDNIYNNTTRSRYNPTFGTASGIIRWPVFNLENWTQCPNGPDGITCNEADAYTLVDDVSVAASPVKGTTATAYWIVNPSAEDVVLKNNYTVRTSRHTTPDSSFGTQSERSEIGLHVFGDIGNYGTQELVSFTDFAVQLGVDSAAVDQESSFGSLE